MPANSRWDLIRRLRVKETMAVDCMLVCLVELSVFFTLCALNILQVYAGKCVVYKACLNLCCGLPAKIIAHPWFTV